MKKEVNQLNRSLFVGFVFLSNLIFSISASRYDSFIRNEWSWSESVLTKSLMARNKECGFWPNYETMIKEMKEIGHINALKIAIAWYTHGRNRQNSYL